MKLGNIKVLRDEKAALGNQARAILDLSAEQERALTGDERAEIDKYHRRMEELNKAIGAVEAKFDEDRIAAREGPAAGSSGTDGGFSGIGEFMQALHRKTHGDLDERLRALQFSAAAINEGLPSEGGYAVPSQFIFDALTPNVDDGASLLLNRCDRVSMSTDKVYLPAFADDSHASKAPFGIQWTTVAEGASFGTAQALPFKKLQLTAKKSGALFAVSNEWLADSNPGMRNRIGDIFSMSLRWFVESKLWGGLGGGEAMGVLTAASTLSIPKETGQQAATLQTENIVKAWARLYPGSHSRAIWVANPTTFPQLATLTVGVGTGGALTGLLNTIRGIAGEPATGIFGRPLYLSEHLPVLGQAGDIVLLDPLLYIMGDRQQVTMDASPHALFTYDQTCYRVSVRFDALPALSSVLTPKNGDTLAPAVKIALRS